MVAENTSTLQIINSKGEKQQVDVVMTFSLDKTNQKYIVYTLNETKNDMVILYASKILEKDGETVFENVSDEEWALIKEKMREAIRSERGNT